MFGIVPFVGVVLFFLFIDRLGQFTHQVLNLVSEVLREVQNQLRGALRAFAQPQQLNQFLGGAQRTQAQRDHPLRGSEDTHRDHVFGFRTGIQIHAAQKQQQLLLRQRQQTRPGVLFQQQVAGKLAQTAAGAQPGMRLRMATIPVQPEAFFWLQCKVLQLGSSDETRPTLTVQNEGMNQPPLRVCFIEHGYFAYSGMVRGDGEMMTPLLSAYRYSPGRNVTPPKVTGTFSSPMPRFSVFFG